MTRLEALRADLARAKDEVLRVQMADPFAFTNGGYDAALRVVATIEREIARAEAVHAHAG